MDRTGDRSEPQRAQRILVFFLAALLFGFSGWCAVLYWRSQALRRDLDSQLRSVESVSWLRRELDRLQAGSGATPDEDHSLFAQQASRLSLGRRVDPASSVAIRKLRRALERLDQALADRSSPDTVWEATVTARATLAALEGRIQAQIADLHRQLGGLWTGLNGLMVASLLLAGSNLGLLRLAYRSRRRLEAAHSEAIRRSTQDPLTGIWNREAILRLLRRELARAQRLQSPLGVILADVDDFQLVNGLLGQDQGDSILEKLADSLGSLVRPYDTMGRFGGDSFLVVLPVCDETATGNVADRLREAINGRDIEHELGRIRITITLAYAAVENAEEEDADLLIHRLQERVEDQQARGPGQVTKLVS